MEEIIVLGVILIGGIFISIITAGLGIPFVALFFLARLFSYLGSGKE